MIHYDRIDAPEGIDVNKTRETKEFDIYYSWCFLNKRVKCRPNVCNRCHDLLMMSMNLSNIDFLNITEIIIRISKSEAINLMQNTNFTEKCRTL